MVDLKTLDALSAYNKVNNLSGSYAEDKLGNSSGLDFTQMVEDALGDVATSLKTAEAKTIGSVTGEVSTEELAIAIANAETSLKTVVAIRDRLVSSFQDIIRMPI